MPVTKGSGNPKWTRDETILALDLYLRLGKAPGPTNANVIALSELLNRMPWHSRESRGGTFRNPDGVSLKLLNMRSFERGYGLSYSKMDEAILTEFASRPDDVARLAETIRKAIDLDEAERTEVPPQAPVEAAEWEFSEGRLLTSIHLRRERSLKVRQTLLMNRKQGGSLACDLCRWSNDVLRDGFDDAVFEAHHLLPLALLAEGRKTKLEDVALLCANCHRLIHRAIVVEGKWLTLDEARGVLARKPGR